MNPNHLINFLQSLALTTTLAGCATYNPETENAPISEVEAWESVSISLSRSSCFGACPSYIVEIKGDGTVNYCGRNFVKEIGIRESRIAEANVKALFRKFKNAGFRSLDEVYRAPVTDLPSSDLRLAYDGDVKTVHDYGGAMIDMPAVVTLLQDAVDKNANTAQWIGKADEKQRVNKQVDCGDRLNF